MNLRLVREPTVDGATLGCLFVDGHFQCFTLEDAIRPDKVPNDTCIPPGTYPVIVCMSQRFKRELPLLMAVYQFEGVRIHAGNTIADTRGCILVGKDRDGGRVLQSRVALESLMAKLYAASAITIRVENPAP